MDVSPVSLDALLNAALLHFLESHTDVRFRHGIAAGLASAINALIERWPAPAGSPAHAQAKRLTEEGWVGLGHVLTAEQVASVVDYFTQRPCFNAHVPMMSDRVARRIGEGAERFRSGSYPSADVMAAPFLLELANRPEILAVAEGYLGCTPTLYSLNAWWWFAGTAPADGLELFHRDLDDYKFCTLLVCLTDVGAQNGPLAYIRRSHRVDLSEAIVAAARSRFTRNGRTLSLDDLYEATQSEAHDRIYADIFEGLVDPIAGTAGSAFIADTSGLHKWLPVAAGRRLMFWARYGLYRNTHASLTGEATVPRSAIGARLPHDARTIYINRCLIREPAGAT